MERRKGEGRNGGSGERRMRRGKEVGKRTENKGRQKI